jgi:hypothetical protein
MNNECQIISPRFVDSQAGSSEETALRILLQAYDCARGLNRDVWQFAVEIAALNHLGVSLCDLRKLVALGLVAHAVERVERRARGRKFQQKSSLAFVDNSCFVLTEKGELYVRRNPAPVPVLQVGSYDAKPNSRQHNGHDSALKPHWDPCVRALYLEDLIVKKFKRPAPHQELVITSFHELGWDRRIDDPIPQEKGMDPKDRLHDTIKKLNRGQLNPVIRFYGDGTGRGVCWELRR